MKIREMLLAGTFVTMMIISAYIIVPIGACSHYDAAFDRAFGRYASGKPLKRGQHMRVGDARLCGTACIQSGTGRSCDAGRTYRRLYHCIYYYGLACWVIFTERDLEASYLKNLMYMCVGMLVCYAIGLIGFKLSFQYFLQKPMSWDNAILLAVAPFLPFDIIKAGRRLRLLALKCARLYSWQVCLSGLNKLLEEEHECY